MSCVYFRNEETMEQFVDYIVDSSSGSTIHVDASSVTAIDETITGINIHGLGKLATKEMLAGFGDQYRHTWVLRVDEDSGFFTIGYFSSDGNYFPNYHLCNKYGIAVDRSGFFYDPKFDNGRFIEEESSWSYISEKFDIFAWEEV